MSQSVLFIFDLMAIVALSFAIYFPRHRRKDLVVAYLAVNIGVLAVAVALASGAVGVGLGLGLFGVLSIIRLRSAELDQQEVAYYFVALSLGLLGGIPVSPSWLSPMLMATLVAAMWVGDHPLLFGRYRAHSMTLDRAFTDEALLIAHLEDLLSARVHRVKVRRVNLVDDTTSVEVRYETADPTGRAKDSEGLVAAGLR